MKALPVTGIAVLLGALAMVIPVTARCESLSLSGADWHIHEDDFKSNSTLFDADVTGAGWIPARVPGNVQADLEAAQIIGPLWYGAGDPKLAEVAEKTWWYRKDFVAPESLLNKRVQIVFDGVDCEYEVWLNGTFLGSREGQFRRTRFDISGSMKIGQKNSLLVKIKHMPVQLKQCFAASDGAQSGVATPDWFINCYISMRQILKEPKSAANLGWDWGVNIFTLGIWRDVWLEATGPTQIEWLQVQSKLVDKSHAVISVSLELEGGLPRQVRARVRVRGHGIDRIVNVSGSVNGEGKNLLTAQLRIQRPSLWWPNGQGEQPLYDLEAQLKDAISGDVLDVKRARFGVREIRWTQVEGAPADFINPYRLVINGRPVRMMGSSLVPPDLLSGRDLKRSLRLLQLAKAAGINTFRLWGGGVTLPPQFYDRADELGIMLSQEFPLANSWPETDAVFLSNLEATTRDIVKELRNHPSIIEWVGGNEMPWESGTIHPALQLLERVCADSDNRIFRATDPIQGSKHSPWAFVPFSHYEHFNQVDVMRYGEFGTQTPANLDVFRREIPQSSQWPLTDTLDPVLIRKNVLQAAFGPLDWLYKPVIEGYFGPLESLDELIPAGQFIGAEGLRYAVDELRRKGSRIGGLTSWDFNEPWPNGAGSYLVDYDGRTLMHYDFMKEALAPVSLSLRYSSNLYDPLVGVHATLWLVSDLPSSASGLKWNWTARDRWGRVIRQGAGTTSIAPQEAKQLTEVRFKPLPDTALGPLFVELRLLDGTGATLAERVQIFGADNVFIWPFDGLLHSTDQNEGDSALLATHPRSTRVLWIQDWNDGRYEDLAWYLRRYGVQVTLVPATREALAKLGDLREWLANYDVVWLGAPDFGKSDTLGARIGLEMLAQIAQAVDAGMGLGVEGGWDSYASAGLDGSRLKDILPVTFDDARDAVRHGSGNLNVSDPLHSLISGRIQSSIPRIIAGYDLVKAKQGSAVILSAGEGDALLVTGAHGQGRTLAYASGLASNGGWHEDKPKDWGWSLKGWSGFPFFVARMMNWLARAPDAEVTAIDLPAPSTRLSRPVRKTTLQWSRAVARHESSNEAVAVTLSNKGPMTALFCSPEPLLRYRTDLTIENDHISIPPGESRTLVIRAPKETEGALTLGESGWRVSCWNTDDLVIEPDKSVLLWLGKRDAMTREYARDPKVWEELLRQGAVGPQIHTGRHPTAREVAWLVPGTPEVGIAAALPRAAEFEFEVGRGDPDLPSRLNIHTADQDNHAVTVVEIDANGKKLYRTLQPGLGVQLTDPDHLAFPHTLTFDLPPGTWVSGENRLKIRVKGGGWFSWDAMDLVAGLSP